MTQSASVFDVELKALSVPGWRLTSIAHFVPLLARPLMFVATRVGVAGRDALWWIGTDSLDFRFGGLSSAGPDAGSWMKGIGSVGGVNVAAAAIAVSAVARFGLRTGTGRLNGSCCSAFCGSGSTMRSWLPCSS